MKSGNPPLINLCVPSMCFTDSPSFSGCCCKAQPQEIKSGQHVKRTHDMQVEILMVVPSHIKTHMQVHVGLGTSTSQTVFLSHCV